MGGFSLLFTLDYQFEWVCTESYGFISKLNFNLVAAFSTIIRSVLVNKRKSPFLTSKFDFFRIMQTLVWSNCDHPLIQTAISPVL